jgi:hypothetical protein
MTTRRARIGRAAAAAALLALGGLARLGPADADPVQEPASIAREAYFTHPITQITPPVLRNGFPPATACLVAGLVGVPQICGTEVQQLVALLGLGDGIPVLVTPDGDLAQPISPGTTPVGMFGGQQRYASLFQLGLPPLPDGMTFGSFALVLHQDGLNFALESPAVRDIVSQVVAQLENQNPQLIADAIVRALSGEVPIADDILTGIEACPVLQTWNGGPAQGASLDGSRLPDIDCQVGTTGVYDASSATWTFDLTFAAQAWTKGTDGAEPLANEGIMLRPAGAPNLAYGDPDLSTNWLVSLADATAAQGLRPVIRYTLVPDDTAGGGDAVLPDDSFEVPPFDSGGSVDLGSPSVGDGSGSTLGSLRARYAKRDLKGSHPHTPGWVWIALPLGAFGAYLFAEALRSSPAASRRRPGALSRLEAALDDDPPDPSPRS